MFTYDLVGTLPPIIRYEYISIAVKVKNTIRGSVALFYSHDHLAVKPELKYLLRELYTKVADKWEDIGIFLGIETGTLDAIKTAENSKPQHCLREMLKLWLSRVSPPPSWAAIADVIEELGEESLAHQLRTKYRVPPYQK